MQDEIQRRQVIGKAYSGNSVLSAKLVCGDCGEWFGPKVWHSTGPNRSVIWQCNAKFDKSKPKCETPHLTEAAVKERFLKVYNTLITDRDTTFTAILAAKEKLMDTTEIDRKLNDMTVEIEAITALMTECINENSAIAQNQDTYKEKYSSYLERYETARRQHDELAMQREAKGSKGKRIDRFLSDLSTRQTLLEEFDNGLWLTVVDRVIVRRDGVLVFCFYDGREIEG